MVGKGALLLELLPIQGVLAIDVTTAFLAITPLFFIQVPQPKKRVEQKNEDSQTSSIASVLGNMRNGLQFILDWRGLTILLLIVMLLNFLTWPLLSLVPILITQHFEGWVMELGWVAN
jgi:DHA3 family macrolide efflux protein-like MFS transporter